ERQVQASSWLHLLAYRTRPSRSLFTLQIRAFSLHSHLHEAADRNGRIRSESGKSKLLHGFISSRIGRDLRALYSRCKSALSRYIRTSMKLPIVTEESDLRAASPSFFMASSPRVSDATFALFIHVANPRFLVTFAPP